MLLAYALLVADVAVADAQSADVHFALEALANAPIDVGGRISVGLPFNLEASVEAGFMPAFYADGVNALLVGVGAYPANIGVVIRTGLQSSFVFRTHLAWHFWRGMYAAAGYGLVTLGGGLSAGEALASISGQDAPAGFAPNEMVRLSSQLHMVDGEVGYRFLFWNQLIVRVALGGAFTVGSQSRVTTDRRLLEQSRYFQEFADAAERFLDQIYRSYVFSPVLTLGVGYRFF